MSHLYRSKSQQPLFVATPTVNVTLMYGHCHVILQLLGNPPLPRLHYMIPLTIVSSKPQQTVQRVNMVT